jgi:hypothetical protein
MPGQYSAPEAAAVPGWKRRYCTLQVAVPAMTEAEATALEQALLAGWTAAERGHDDAMRTGHQCPHAPGQSCPARETAGDLFALWADAATDANAIRSFPGLVATLNQR